MTNTPAESRIDVRELPPRERHPTLFGLWDALPDLGALVLTNDHDPLPLYYQFAAEWAGRFQWEYLQSGPDVWEVRIQKGDFSDPGFRPTPGARGSCRPVAVPIEFQPTRLLDVCPILAAGESPCEAIDAAVAKLIPGQTLVILAPFEPVPLYTKLGLSGFGHETQRLRDDLWRIEFRRE